MCLWVVSASRCVPGSRTAAAGLFSKFTRTPLRPLRTLRPCDSVRGAWRDESRCDARMHYATVDSCIGVELNIARHQRRLRGRVIAGEMPGCGSDGRSMTIPKIPSPFISAHSPICAFAGHRDHPERVCCTYRNAACDMAVRYHRIGVDFVMLRPHPSQISWIV